MNKCPLLRFFVCFEIKLLVHLAWPSKLFLLQISLKMCVPRQDIWCNYIKHSAAKCVTCVSVNLQERITLHALCSKVQQKVKKCTGVWLNCTCNFVSHNGETEGVIHVHLLRLLSTFCIRKFIFKVRKFRLYTFCVRKFRLYTNSVAKCSKKLGAVIFDTLQQSA